MAGVTTAPRMGLGAIASSEASNPEAMAGFLASGSGNNDYWISNIPTSDYHDLEVWFKSSNQSSWTVWWGFQFGTAGQTSQSSKMYQSYFYKGYSSGSGNGTQSGSYAYNNPAGYSSYGHYCRLYVSNYSSTSNIKSWHAYGGYTNGSATSYVTYQQMGGSIREANPLTDIKVFNGYGNGSTSYQGWSVFGRRPK